MKTSSKGGAQLRVRGMREVATELRPEPARPSLARRRPTARASPHPFQTLRATIQCNRRYVAANTENPQNRSLKSQGKRAAGLGPGRAPQDVAEGSERQRERREDGSRPSWRADVLRACEGREIAFVLGRYGAILPAWGPADAPGGPVAFFRALIAETGTSLHWRAGLG
jgi:hypothetical protein